MDLLNFVLSILLIFIALQAQQMWIVFALIILSILTFKSFKIALALIVSAVVVYFAFGSGDLLSNFPLIIVALLVVGLILGVGGKEQEAAGGIPPELLGGYGGMFGGEGGY